MIKVYLVHADDDTPQVEAPARGEYRIGTIAAAVDAADGAQLMDGTMVTRNAGDPRASGMGFELDDAVAAGFERIAPGDRPGRFLIPTLTLADRTLRWSRRD